MSKIYIVAEIGCNHNGDYATAKKMIDEAKFAGVDAVKFQTFKAEQLISKIAPKAEYQLKVTNKNESQLDMTKKLELAYDDYEKLSAYALDLGLDVFSTPFDFQSIDFLASKKQIKWKIPSGEITNLPYLEKIAKLKIDNMEIILSTGMANKSEIDFALNVFLENEFTKKSITILHCNTEYPTPYKDLNLNTIKWFKDNYKGYKIGLSDHSEGFYSSVASAALGIDFIEKHFTLDKDLPGPDHKASVNPNELYHLCKGIRAVEMSMGNYEKAVTNSEAKNKIIARKSIVAKKKIEQGDTFSEDNITTKRPGNGISPMFWKDLIGKKSESEFNQDELIVDSRFKKQD